MSAPLPSTSSQSVHASPRDVVFPPGRQALYEKNRYSPAIRSNGFLFVSGQVGSRPDGSPEPDFEAQVRLAFDNLNAVLKAAGCTFDDVIDVTVFMVNPEAHFEAAWAVVDPILGTGTPVHEYAPGTWGPTEASALAADVGGWYCPDGRTAS